NSAPLKLSRVVATGAAAALVAGSTLLVGGTAAAADFWVEADDFGVEGTSYPEGWFIGDGTLGTISSGVSGLTMDGTDGLVQILNGTPGTGTLSELVGSAALLSIGPDAVSFQIPMFQNFDGADTNYT